MNTTEINAAALATARASLAYVIADAGEALRIATDEIIAGKGANLAGIAKYSAEIAHAHRVSASLEADVVAAAGTYLAAAAAERARTLIARINNDGLARMRAA